MHASVGPYKERRGCPQWPGDPLQPPQHACHVPGVQFSPAQRQYPHRQGCYQVHYFGGRSPGASQGRLCVWRG